MSEQNGSTTSWQEPPRRKGNVGLILAGVIMFGIAAVLFAINPYLPLVPAGLLLVVLLHWLLWGKSLTRDMQQERERLLAEEAKQQTPTQGPSAPWERRF